MLKEQITFFGTPLKDDSTVLILIDTDKIGISFRKFVDYLYGYCMIYNRRVSFNVHITNRMIRIPEHNINLMFIDNNDEVIRGFNIETYLFVPAEFNVPDEWRFVNIFRHHLELTI